MPHAIVTIASTITLLHALSQRGAGYAADNALTAARSQRVDAAERAVAVLDGELAAVDGTHQTSERGRPARTSGCMERLTVSSPPRRQLLTLDSASGSDCVTGFA